MKLLAHIEFKGHKGEIVELGFNDKWQFTKRIRMPMSKPTRWSPCIKRILSPNKRDEAIDVLELLKKKYLEKTKKNPIVD